MKRYILTGTPGCGKTSILRALEMQGYFVVNEAATDIIAYEQMQDNCQPWQHPIFIVSDGATTLHEILRWGLANYYLKGSRLSN